MTRNVLTMKQRHHLTVLVGEAYVSSNLNDREFAEKATEELKFPVNASHVGSCRNVLEIPAKKFTMVPGASQADMFELHKKVQELTDARNMDTAVVLSLGRRLETLESDIKAFKLAMKFNSKTGVAA